VEKKSESSAVCHICPVENEIKAIHRGMYGDPDNKVTGMIDKVNCLVEYKPELKLLRSIKKNIIKITLSVFIGVSIAVIGGYITWHYVR